MVLCRPFCAYDIVRLLVGVNSLVLNVLSFRLGNGVAVAPVIDSADRWGRKEIW